MGRFGRIKKLRQPSTWKGLFVLLGLAGVTLTPAEMEAVRIVSMLVVGAIGTWDFGRDEEKQS